MSHENESVKKRDDQQDQQPKAEAEKGGKYCPALLGDAGTKVGTGIEESSEKSTRNVDNLVPPTEIYNFEQIRDSSQSDEYWDEKIAELKAILKEEDEANDEAHLYEDHPKKDDSAGENKEGVDKDRDKDREEDSGDDPDKGQRPVGRPRVLNGVKKAQICAFLRVGCSRREAAVEVGCHYKSFLREIGRDPVFAEDVDFAERKGYVRPLLQIIKASQHSWRAAAWLMKYHRPANAMSKEERQDKDREIIQGLKEFDILWRDSRP